MSVAAEKLRQDSLRTTRANLLCVHKWGDSRSFKWRDIWLRIELERMMQ